MTLAFAPNEKAHIPNRDIAFYIQLSQQKLTIARFNPRLTVPSSQNQANLKASYYDVKYNIKFWPQDKYVCNLRGH